MGSFAASLFNFMLGWLRNLASGLWDLTKSQQTRDMLTWLGEHWLTLVLLLAAGGLVIDYIVWFVRWRPYYVWASWLRRLFGRREDKKEEVAGYPQYAPRQAAYPLPAAQERSEQEWQQETRPYGQPIQPAREEPVYEKQNYEQVAAYGEPVDYAAYQRPDPETEEYSAAAQGDPAYASPEEPWRESQPEEPAVNEPVHPGLSPSMLEEKMGWTTAPAVRQRRSRNPRSQRGAPQPLDWVRTGISQVAQKMDFIGRDQDEMEEYIYTPPPPAVDKDQAFHAPVYPTLRDERKQQGEPEE